MAEILMDPDIARVLSIAGINPVKATDLQIALADRMLQIYTTQDGKVRFGAAGDALWRRLNGGTQ
jgi:hypothetical protein